MSRLCRLPAAERSGRCRFLAPNASGWLSVTEHVLAGSTVLQFNGDPNSLARDSSLYIMNLVVATVCLVALLAAGACFGQRAWIARRAGTVWGPRRQFLLAMTGVDTALQVVNLALYLASNAIAIQVGRVAETAADAGRMLVLTPWPSSHPHRPFSGLQVDCAWFQKSINVFFMLSTTIWNTLLLINVSRALILLPRGAWARLRSSWAGGGRLCRCAAASCCGCCEAPPPDAVERGTSKLSQQPMQLDVRAAHWAHAVVFCCVWIPNEVLIVCTSLGTMGYLGKADPAAWF